MRGFVVICRAVMLRSVMMRRGVMVRAVVKVIKVRRRRRNERRGQLGPGLRFCRRRLRRRRRLRGRRLIGWGLLCTQRRRQNHGCGAGKDDTQHDSLPSRPRRLRLRPPWEDSPAFQRRHLTLRASAEQLHGLALMTAVGRNEFLSLKSAMGGNRTAAVLLAPAHRSSNPVFQSFRNGMRFSSREAQWRPR